MAKQRYEDCHCEDYPCCGHYDILYGDEMAPEYCDRCGGYHRYDLDCDFDDDDEDTDDEDVIALRDPKHPPHCRHGIPTKECARCCNNCNNDFDDCSCYPDEVEDAHLEGDYEDRVAYNEPMGDMSWDG